MRSTYNTNARRSVQLSCLKKPGAVPWEGWDQNVPHRYVPREKIVRMIERAARDTGLGLREFYELGRNDHFDDPELRDLWLIWGDTITENDLLDET